MPNTLRDFTDRDGNFVPDCDHRNLFANGECGTADNTAFGSQVLNPPQFDPDVDTGFMHRPYSWEISTGVQHHVMQGLGVEFGFFRRWQGNQKATDNLKLAPGDFKEFCVAVPTAAQANGKDIAGAGQQLCGFYDFTQQRTDLLGQVQNYTTHAKNFGDEIWVFNGFEFNVNARMPGGLQLTGGTMTQRTRIESCYAVDSPMYSPTESRGHALDRRYHECAGGRTHVHQHVQEHAAVQNDDETDGNVSAARVGHSGQRHDSGASRTGPQRHPHLQPSRNPRAAGGHDAQRGNAGVDSRRAEHQRTRRT